ncbi:MAG: flagellar hook protein FlgE [Hoeflea sp.]|uniref:flagellar hook protein FlgE n=1 Tax=Hoeflea sp. TaxID=1940281 RepID=UPI001D481810|nr:flagellar hook protein FlgE [Hoeflea sp.]MBU4528961.1 flagellar hook protein FlgE [Alphaproteobacteria bacterium]MBU4544094.1 flagellar hook protein FlgE [Alphaproteobacteria bacterium]MBU4551963.1 flagellar hook protein FlgE [Alphaproteobacteria bacterium]MBV1723428.1 flagellar hook protein FlgE [Hoeflea sp.]MBV1760407.1 flagellar hook protein FlgE [Hoeflea sp.]
MSLYGMMSTGASGMNAQANRLSTVADNIANANTTGYKKASVEFSSLVLPGTNSSYNSGAVQTDVRYAISQPGTLAFTTSTTDLAIDGDGFFIVQDSNGVPFLTRAGSFVPDGDGNLVNAAGYTLLGYDYESGVPAPVVNGFDGLVPVNISSGSLAANASTLGIFSANLDAGKDIVAAADLPSTNSATAEYSHKSSLVAYDNLGGEVLLDFYYTKSGANTWEVTVYDRAGATPGTSFPYAAGALLQTETLTFDPLNKGLLAAASPTDIALTVPGGAALTVDLSEMTQLDYAFTVQKGDVNGNAPSAVTDVVISEDGTIYAKQENGELKPLYRIALASVSSPDKLRPLAGNVYQQGVDSGVITTGFAGSSGFGKIVSSALESSNVDMAQELTDMIASQRSYTANSKVFQTGSDLMDVLVNLKR